MEIKKIYCQDNKIKAREIKNEWSNKKGFNKTIKIK